jgi:hypothetical protein
MLHCQDETGVAVGYMRFWKPLRRYYEALRKYLRQGNETSITDWTSMDHSPRNPYLRGGGASVDISSQMTIFARDL